MKNKKIWKRIISTLLALVLFIGDGVLFLTAEDDIDIDLVTGGFVRETYYFEAAGEKAVATAVAAGFDSVTISVDLLTEAINYEIQRSTKKSSGFKKVVDEPSGIYTDTGLKTGTTYYYRVRAIFNDGVDDFFGPFSDVVKAKPVPAQAVILSATDAVSAILVEVDPVPGASGYQVVYSDRADFKGAKKKTSAAATCTISGLPNKTYFVKVRAFKKVGKTVVYGEFSADNTVVVNIAPQNIAVSKTEYLEKKYQSGTNWYKSVRFTVKNNGALPVKFYNKVGYAEPADASIGFSDAYYLANAKGKKKSSITINAGKTVKLRIRGKKVGFRQYAFPESLPNRAFLFKTGYDGIFYATVSESNVVYIIATLPSSSGIESIDGAANFYEVME